MNRASIYIQRLEIENVKTFVKKSILQLTDSNGLLSQWTLILGDNSIGKSTLLQMIALMKPVLPYDGKIPKYFRPEPGINNEENEFLEGLVHKSGYRKQQAFIKAVFVANQQLRHEITNPNINFHSKTTIFINTRGKLKDIENEFDANKESKKIFYYDEVLLYAYSASRKLGKLNLEDDELDDTIPGFIKENTELYDAEEILHNINYALLDALPDDKVKYETFMQKIKQMLVDLLPDISDAKSIEVNSPRITNSKKLLERSILLTTKHGKKIPFGDFSLGYKTVSSWTIDLAWRLFKQYYHQLPNPLEGPAIVLIDELDLHLHPKWQRVIMNKLSDSFPNVQFIASAHSPLMVQTAVDANYAVLKFDGNQVFIENNPRGIDGWRVDQILTSEFFDLPSLRSPSYDKLTERHEELSKKQKLNKKEKDELESISLDLFNSPVGKTPEEIDSRNLVLEIISKLQK